VRQGGCLPAILFHLAFWHMDLGYFGRGLFGSWPQSDAGVVLWSTQTRAEARRKQQQLESQADSSETQRFIIKDKLGRVVL
jgi:hypothetical protein